MKTRGPFHRAARAVARRALRRAAKKLPAVRELPLGAFRLERDAHGELTLDTVALRDVAERYGTPLHVVDAVRLRENAARFTHSPAAAGRGCEVFYSYKTNPVPGVLTALHAAGVGAETSSPYELWLAGRLGVPGSHTIYNCPVKPIEALREAIARGVALINLNSRQEIRAICAAAREVGRSARVGVRVAMPFTVAGPFGERIDNGAALQTFAEALERPELEVVGLHAQYNGELSTREAVHSFVSAVLRFVSQLRARLSTEVEVIDLGGNLASQTVTPRSWVTARLEMAMAREAVARSPSAVLSIDDYVAQVTAQIEAHYRRAGRRVPRLFVEPGRAMTSNAQLLLLKVLSVTSPDDTGIATAVLDGGVNVAEPLRSERHQLFHARIRPGAELRAYRLTGPTCTRGDLLYPFSLLPRLEVGDTLAVMDSGAYFEPFATNFSFPRPGVVMLEHGRATLLRRAETFEDLVARDGLKAVG